MTLLSPGRDAADRGRVGLMRFGAAASRGGRGGLLPLCAAFITHRRAILGGGITPCCPRSSRPLAAGDGRGVTSAGALMLCDIPTP